jgi:hypothetical protein
MEKIEIVTPEPEKARLVLQDAIKRHKQLLAQSVARTQIWLSLSHGYSTALPLYSNR